MMRADLAQDMRNAVMNVDLRPGLPTMRLAGALIAAAWMLTAAVPAEAGLFMPATGRWCALTAIGLNDCSYDTFEQCMATLSGVGGVCNINPQAPSYADDPPPRRKRRVKVPG